jgi:nucleoside-diphosphate-sugar epimerase
MKILVTGATGYVGHNLALTLAGQGNDVHILVRSLQSAFIPQHPNIHVFAGDITKKETIIIAMQGCEKVFHTAALVQYYASDPSIFYDINVEGTRNVLDTALQLGVQKFVFTSTCGVIGPSLHEPMTETDPRIIGFDSDYDISKFLAEKLVVEYSKKGMFAVIVSASKVFGPGIETHPISVNSTIKRVIEGKLSFCPGNPHFISNYVFIDDLVRGHMLAMEKGTSGEKYILGGENLSYAEFFQIIRDFSGVGGILFPVPENMAKLYGFWHVLQSKLLGKEAAFSAKSVKHIYCNKSFSSLKAIKELGYSITPFAMALRSTIQFLTPYLSARLLYNNFWRQHLSMRQSHEKLSPTFNSPQKNFYEKNYYLDNTISLCLYHSFFVCFCPGKQSI